MFTALLKLTFIRNFQYRGYLIINYIAMITRLFVEISLWWALFRANPEVKGTTFHDMINYLAITAFLGLFSISQAGYRLSNRISSGAISTDLIRPYNLKAYLIAQSIGENIASFLLYTLPIYGAVLVIFGIKLPYDPLRYLLFFISVLLGGVIYFYYSYIMGMLAFWLQTTWYISWAEDAMFTLFAGTIVPLWFFPEFLNKISYLLPFRYITYEAVAFYLGRTELSAMQGVLAMQLFWIVILVFLEAVLWRKAQKKIMVFGG